MRVHLDHWICFKGTKNQDNMKFKEKEHKLNRRTCNGQDRTIRYKSTRHNVVWHFKKSIFSFNDD